MKSLPALTPIRLAALALAASLGACSSIDGALSGDKVDYRTGNVKAKALEVPPDLTQLARESRYQVQGGVITASAAGSTPAAAATAATAVAVAAPAGMRVERTGQQRWLVTQTTPEQLWPQLKAFWEQRGFTIEVDNAAAGVMETNWAENRSKLPNDVIRNTLGRLIGGLYDTGERDRYRTRIERTSGGTEVYISHRGVEEAYVDGRQENTYWRPRAADPQLEAEMLSRLMLALGPRDEPAQVRAQVANAPETVARARAAGTPAALELDEPFDRAWRRVGLALDRGGFTVEDRDRNAGLYYVRYVDPKSAGKDEPNFFAKLLGDGSNPQAAVRYRIALKGNGNKTAVSVLTSAGAADSGENGKNIAALLIKELR